MKFQSVISVVAGISKKSRNMAEYRASSCLFESKKNRGVDFAAMGRCVVCFVQQSCRQMLPRHRQRRSRVDCGSVKPLSPSPSKLLVLLMDDNDEFFPS